MFGSLANYKQFTKDFGNFIISTALPKASHLATYVPIIHKT